MVKHPNLLLLSVPHTGTTFAEKFLNTAGLLPHRDRRIGYVRIHSRREDLDHIVWKKYENLFDVPTIITRRDPLLSLRSHLTRKTGTLEDVKESFRILTEELIEKVPKYFIFDLHCPEHLREKHLLDCAEFAGANIEKHLPGIQHYAREWKPINQRTNLEFSDVPANAKNELKDAIFWFKHCAVE